MQRDKRVEAVASGALTREKMKIIHMLANHGARWMPEDENQMNQVRNSLMRLEPTYTVELVWIMAKYGGCNRSVIEAVLNQKAIQKHLSWHMDLAAELMARLPQAPK